MKSEFLTQEEEVKDPIFVCPLCSKPCCRDNSLITHMHKTHQKEITETAPYAVSLKDVICRLKKDHQCMHYKCLKCSSIITSRLKMSAHLCVDPATASVTCKTACRDGIGLSNWQRVIFLKRKRQYLCHTCGTPFADKTAFTMHVQSHGVEGVELKKFVCEHCPYATNNKFYFKIHTRGQHCEEPRPRPHVCELCGKTFVFKGVLEQHRQYMHVKDKVFQCQLCPKFFYRRQGLARHLRTHSGQRPWVCGQCGQGFTVKYNLKVHERLHSGEKPYQCQQCDAAFAQKNSLNVHMKKHQEVRGDGAKGKHSSRSRRSREAAAPASSSSSSVTAAVPCQRSSDSPGLECYPRGAPGVMHTRPETHPPHAPHTVSDPTSNPVSVQKDGDLSTPQPAGEGSEPLPQQPASQASSALNVEPVVAASGQYGYPMYPDYTMAVFPPLTGTSYQFVPVTRP